MVESSNHLGDATVSSQTDKEYYVLFQPKSFADLAFAEQNIVLIEQTVTSVYQNEKVYKLTATDEVTVTLTYLVGETAETVTKTPVTLTLDTVKVGNDFVLSNFGVSLSKYQYRYNFGQAMMQTGKDFTTSVTAVARGLASLFTPSGIGNVSGPVGIFTQVSGALTNFGNWSIFILLGLN